MSEGDITLVLKRTIRASKRRLFSAWTDPEQLVKWWGPAWVRCSAAELDLRVGGHYRIDNALPDGSVAVISGTFERVSPPDELVYTWHLGGHPAEGAADSRVTVRFDETQPGTTDVIIVHERIASAAIRDDHEKGWLGCLDSLEQHLAAA